MNTAMGEYLVGAYLSLVLECDFVGYNVRVPGGGMRGLNELDVVGLDFSSNTAYLCEVTTHIRGALYTDNKTTVATIEKKHRRQQEYAHTTLTTFDSVRYMFWSPYVPRGYITKHLAEIETLELVINGRYKACVGELRALAKEYTHDTQNPFFRVLQILENMRDD